VRRSGTPSGKLPHLSYRDVHVGQGMAENLCATSGTIAQLQDTIIACTRCPRLVAHRRQVAEHKVRRFRHDHYWGRPVPSFGDHTARLLIVGLAPAAHGGNRTGRAFTGDRSGSWLHEALYTFGFASQPTSERHDDGLILRDCYITQVLHCAPPGNKPTHEEIDSCQPYMLAEFRMLTNVRVLIPLGKIAFDACLRIYRQLYRTLPTPLPRFGHGLQYRLPNDLILLPSYHPSQQNTHTGRLTRAMFHQIFAAARAVLSISLHNRGEKTA
jgi:uracil-DNA glycosylase family 4